MQVGDLVKLKINPNKIGVVMKLWTETLGQGYDTARYRMCKIYWNDHSFSHTQQKVVEVIDG